MPDSNEKRTKDRKVLELRDALRENLKRRKAAPAEDVSGGKALLRRTDSLAPRLSGGTAAKPADKKLD